MASQEYKTFKVVQSDYEEWCQVFKLYLEFYHSSIPDEQYSKTFNRILDENNDLYGLVTKGEDGKIVGLAHFFPVQSPWSESKIMHINDLYVDKTIRGKGLGRMLINDAADIAKKQGFMRVQWTTKHDNATARRLYDSLGTCDFVQYRMNLN